jgi:hypothetical protein
MLLTQQHMWHYFRSSASGATSTVAQVMRSVLICLLVEKKTSSLSGTQEIAKSQTYKTHTTNDAFTKRMAHVDCRCSKEQLISSQCVASIVVFCIDG